jgi:hypothetical protein
LKVAKEIAQAVDDVLRKETGREIPDEAGKVHGVIVIRFRKDGASSTVMGEMSLLQVADIFDQLLSNIMPTKSKGESIAVA